MYLLQFAEFNHFVIYCAYYQRKQYQQRYDDHLHHLVLSYIGDSLTRLNIIIPNFLYADSNLISKIL
jgi:hypothetical protein